MQHEHFEELKEWSERKHELVSKYLTGFVRILGGSRRGMVYYIDGFAGPGIYRDGAKGSPVRAAEYAQQLSDNYYQLHCINVEADQECFNNLVESTVAYRAVVTNYLGTFASHLYNILDEVGNCPTIFFLDPFGLKGIEWRHLRPILERRTVTEVLLRINPKDISRLAGFSGSAGRGAEKKRQVLTELYGFADSSQWEAIWESERSEGLVRLYEQRLVEAMMKPRGQAYVGSYEIKTIEGEVKYHLLFLTRHPKGAILMSDTIYGREKCYERDVRDYKRECRERQTAIQLEMFAPTDLEASEEKIFELQVEDLKERIWQKFYGTTSNRLAIRKAMLPALFGQIGGSHVTQALKKLEEEGRIVNRSGPRSQPYSKFEFSDTS